MDKVELFKKYGFSEYEAKIYLSLLKEHPLNGNNISIQSGVPSAKVYQNLPRLLDKGYIFLLNNGTPKSKKFYVPLPWEKLLKFLENSHKQDMENMKLYLNSIETNTIDDWSRLYHIEGYEANMELFQQLIQQAESSILLSCWDKELIINYKDIESASNRGVSVVSILFDQTSFTDIPWKFFQHHKGEHTSARHLGELVAIFDQKKAFILSSKDSTHGIISNHSALINVAENYIRHDIYINRILTDFEDILTKRYGKSLEKLITDF